MEVTPTEAFEARYFSGSELYGDAFGPAEIERWFSDERDGYAELRGADRASWEYAYDALNRHHAFSLSPSARRYAHALGFGSNFGDELRPLLWRIDQITLLDASNASPCASCNACLCRT